MEDRLTNLLIALILVIVIGLAGIYAYKFFESSTQVALEPNYQPLNYIEEKSEINIQNTNTNKSDKNQNETPSTSIVIPVVETKESEKTEPVTATTETYSYNNRYYYNQLNKYGKAIYDAVAGSVDKLKSGNGTINIDYDFNQLLNEQSGDIKLKQYYSDAINALNLDIPNLFYIDLTKLSLNIESTTSIFGTKYNLYIDPGKNPSYYLDGFYSSEQVESAINKVETLKNHQVDRIRGEDYTKIKLLHDWLIDYISYSSDSSNKCTVYGALTEKKSVCEGYARTYKYILDSMGIENVLIIGSATNSSGNTEEHMWNYVKLNDHWYAVDCTWDDPIVYGGGTIGYDVKHKYFMIGSEALSNTHVAKNTISPEGMSFTLPTLSINKY